GYPPELLAWFAERLDLRPGRTVLDLGAGTGKLSRSLVETGARVLALEPGDEMRARLAAAVPAAEPIAAGPGAIPLPDPSAADALVERLATVSFVASSSPERREELERRLRELAAAEGGVVRFAYLTQAYVTFSVG